MLAHYELELPKGLPDMWALKRCFILQGDYSQAENRIITLLSGDPVMLDLYRRSIDVHSYTAANLFGVEYDHFLGQLDKGNKRYKQWRQMAKTVRYGMHYMGSASTIYAQLVIKDPSVTLNQVRYMCDQFQELHRPIINYHVRNMALAAERDYLEAPLSGRRLYFHGQVDLTLLANWPIQTTGADIINRAVLMWDKIRTRDIDNGIAWRKWEALRAQVHDSLVVSTPDPFGSMLKLSESMAAPIEIGGESLDLPVDFELGVHMGPKRDTDDGGCDWGLKGVELGQDMVTWVIEAGRRSGILVPAR